MTLKTEKKNDDCDFKINGICSTEDIGGVENELINCRSCYGGGSDYYSCCDLKITNYNNFTVTVLIDVIVSNKSVLTLTKILKSEETKTLSETNDYLKGRLNIRTISRRLN